MADTWNPADKDGTLTLSGGDLTVTKTGASSFGNVRSTTSKTTGKHYYEATAFGSLGNAGIGVANASASLTNYLGVDSNSYGWYDTGFGGSTTFVAGDVIGIAIDCDADLIWFAKNGTFTGNPVAGTGGISLSAGTYFATASIQYNTANGFITNFGNSAFAYTPPSGFSAWDAPTGTDGNATGAALSYTLSLISGAATGQANAIGAGTTVTLSLVAGTSNGAANAGGAALSFGHTLTAGAANRQANAAGATTSFTYALVAGAASAISSGGAIWTPVTPASGIWSLITPDDTTWTLTAPDDSIWTQQ